LVEAVDPDLHGLEVLRVRRHHEERIEALDRDQAHRARERALLPEHLLVFADDGLHVGALDLEETDRVPGEEVHVEHLDRVDQVAQLPVGAREDHHVADLVHADRVVRRERREEGVPFPSRR
jgi:hypothetical protein